MSPEINHRAVNWSGASRCQWRRSKKNALMTDTLTAAIDRTADRRGCLLVKTIIKRKAINGSSVARIAAVNDGLFNPFVFIIIGSGFPVQGSRLKVQGSGVIRIISKKVE